MPSSIAVLDELGEGRAADDGKAAEGEANDEEGSEAGRAGDEVEGLRVLLETRHELSRCELYS